MIFTGAIKKNGDFARIYKNGRHYAGRCLVLYVLKGDPGVNALGVSAGKKVGGSVRRNRQKRLVKENYRLMEGFVRSGHMLVFVVRAQDALTPDFYEIRREMKGLLSKAGIFDNDKWENSQERA